MAKKHVFNQLYTNWTKRFEQSERTPVNPFAIGCELHMFEYEEQLAFKKEFIENLFLDKGFEVKLDAMHGSPILYGYRNKMEYSFGDECKGGILNLGMHKPGRFFDIVSTPDLYIVDEDFNKIVAEVQDYVRREGILKFDKKHKSGVLRNLSVRKGYHTGEILIALSTSYEDFDVQKFKQMLLNLDLQGKIVGILHLKNDSVADVVKSGPDDELIYGRDYYNEIVLGLHFKVSFFSFFQTNVLAAQVLYSKALEMIKGMNPTLIFDLFCGTGTITQLVSKAANRVIGIEIVQDAVNMAMDNASENGITNCSFIADDVFKAMNSISENPDLIIMDPPRAGVGVKALEKIVGYGVQNILYISCNPKTFVIDYESLNASGYKITRVEGVDLYPHTKHCEIVALLEKNHLR